MPQAPSTKASCTDGAPPPPERPRLVDQRFDVAVSVDQALCIEGCNLCVEVCPLDALAIDPDTGKAYMHVDECWYCGPCADRCPTGAVTVNIPYLLR
jgi:formate hydrogenlyase subunit 6/NADH:ubiquinone oxidoreductase subunit I